MIQPVHTSGRWIGGTVALLAVALLGLIRAGSELAMMGAFDSDPQLPIWMMFLVAKVTFWLLLGGVLAALLFVWPKRKFLLVGLLVVWGIAIGAASWQYFSARHALVAAANPLTSPDRLRALVHFHGIQAGYELDNRIASNPKTPVEALRVSRQAKPASDRQVKTSHFEKGNIRPTGLQRLVPRKEAGNGECSQDGAHRVDTFVTCAALVAAPHRS